MAHKRMFSKDITTSDAFREMPTSSQALYFHLGMEADDDGFLDNYKGLMRAVNATDDDLRILIAKRFLILFPSKVVVVKHWLINNTVRKDRYNETKHLEEKRALIIKENGAYTDDSNYLPSMATTGLPYGNPEEDSIEEKSTRAPEDGRRGSTPTFGGEEGVEVAPRAPRQAKTPVSTVIEIWNKYPNWKATGSKATPKNPSVIQELLPPAKDVKALNGVILKKRSKYSEEDFDHAIRQYASEVANRNKDAKGYYQHRFTLYEFLTRHDIFERYVTR